MQLPQLDTKEFYLLPYSIALKPHSLSLFEMFSYIILFMYWENLCQ